MTPVPSPAELERIAGLLRERITDAAIQKIRQPGPTRFIFDVFRSGPGRTRLLVDLDPRHLRLHPTERRWSNPPEAPPLLLALRRLLENGRVREVAAHAGDRVVEIGVDRLSGEELTRWRLILELIPTRPALFVVGPDGIVEAASNSVRSEYREVKRGARYVSPRPATLGEAPEPFARFGPCTDDELVARLDAEIGEDEVPDGPDRGAMKKALAKAVIRQGKRVSKVEQDWRRSEGGEQLFRQGELLKASLGECRRGMRSIRVRDWSAEDERWIEIPLDDTLDPQENLDALFRRAKKKTRGQEQILERLEEQRERLRELNALSAALDEASGSELESLLERFAALEIPVEAAPRPSGPARAKAAPTPRKPYHVYRSKDGLEIRVGRGARENDELTFKHCRGNEWWLHVQDYAGSHVVVKTEAELPEQTLLDAATLAALASKAKRAHKVSVSYTQRKNVSKARGAPAGQVMLKSHRTILVRIEPERIERLEKSRG